MRLMVTMPFARAAADGYRQRTNVDTRPTTPGWVTPRWKISEVGIATIINRRTPVDKTVKYALFLCYTTLIVCMICSVGALLWWGMN